MMENVKMKYVGENPTRVRTEKNGVKVDVEPGQTVEFEHEMAMDLLNGGYKRMWMTNLKKGVVDPEKVSTDEDADEEKKTAKKKK